MTKTFKQLREINLNTALLKPRADQIRKQATAGKWDGQDKKDFETAAKFLDKGDLKGFSKFIHTLDTFPRDEILHSAGLWNSKILGENFSHVGKNVNQKLSYDNWLKKVKGIEKGAYGIKGDEHTKFSKQWKDYRGKEKLAASYEQVKEETEFVGEGYENNMITHLGELGIDVSFRLGKMIVHKSDLQRVKDALKDGIADRGSVISYHRMPQIKVMGEEVELEEGRMKELHTLIQQGKSAEEIAKIMKLDVKTIKSLMPKEDLEEANFKFTYQDSFAKVNMMKVISAKDEDSATTKFQKIKPNAKIIDVEQEKLNIGEVSPPGWGGSVKAMKKHADIDNPYALAWHMKNKGDKPHYKDKDGTPVKKDKYKDEQMEQVKLVEKVSVKDLELVKKSEGQYYAIIKGIEWPIEKILPNNKIKASDKAGNLHTFNINDIDSIKHWRDLGEEVGLTEKLDVKWDKDKEGWFDKQGKRRYLGKGATTDLMRKAIDKAKASGDWIKPFDLQHGQRPEEKEIEMKKENKYFDTKSGSIEDSIKQMYQLESTEVTVNRKELDKLVKQYIAKGGTVTKLPPALKPGEDPDPERKAYKVKKVAGGWKILKASLREFIKTYNEHFLTNYAAEEFIAEEK